MKNIAEVTQLVFDVIKLDTGEALYNSAVCGLCTKVALTMVHAVCVCSEILILFVSLM